MTDEQIRVVEALLSTARDEHAEHVRAYSTGVLGHSSLSEYGPDTTCLHCGHINEAEYMLAEAGSDRLDRQTQGK